MEVQWNLVYTQPQFEKKIYKMLERSSITAYLPVQTVLREWSDRKKRISLPLFPNYVFVNVNLRERYKVLSVPGVTRFISFGGQLASIPECDINYLKMLSETDWDIKKENFYETGDKVRVIKGPLTGLEGVLVERTRSQRFLVHFKSFAQSISIDIQTSCLETIKSG